MDGIRNKHCVSGAMGVEVLSCWMQRYNHMCYIETKCKPTKVVHLRWQLSVTYQFELLFTDRCVNFHQGRALFRIFDDSYVVPYEEFIDLLCSDTLQSKFKGGFLNFCKCHFKDRYPNLWPKSASCACLFRSIDTSKLSHWCSWIDRHIV